MEHFKPLLVTMPKKPVRILSFFQEKTAKIIHCYYKILNALNHPLPKTLTPKI